MAGLLTAARAAAVTGVRIMALGPGMAARQAPELHEGRERADTRTGIGVRPPIAAPVVAEVRWRIARSTAAPAISLFAAGTASTSLSVATTVRVEAQLTIGRSTMAADRSTSPTTTEAGAAGHPTTTAPSTVDGVGDRATTAVLISHIMGGVTAITVAGPGTRATTAGVASLPGTTHTVGLIMATAARGARRAAGRTTGVDTAGMTAGMLPIAVIAVRGKLSG